MRDHLLQDVDSHGAMILQLASSCSGMQLTNAERPPDVSCNNTLRCLQERAPQFFELVCRRILYVCSGLSQAGPWRLLVTAAVRV